MYYDIEKPKLNSMNLSLFKYKLSFKKDKEKLNSYRENNNTLVKSFRQKVLNQKVNASKYKTSKNSRKFKILNLANRYKEEKNLNNAFTSRQEKGLEKYNFEKLFNQKILKVQSKTKKTLTTLPTHNNSINVNHNIISSKANHKTKFIFQNSIGNAIHNDQKRSNSALEDDYYNYSNSKKYVYGGLSASSSKKKTNMKSAFQHVIAPKNFMMFNHLKNTSINSSTTAKPTTFNFSVTTNIKTTLPKFNDKPLSKTSYPTKENSRKQSVEHGSSKCITSRIKIHGGKIKEKLKIGKDLKLDICGLNLKEAEIPAKQPSSKKQSTYAKTSAKSSKYEKPKGNATGQVNSSTNQNIINISEVKNDRDCDLENSSNLNDTLLGFINNNIDSRQNPNNSNMNSSYDSILSQQENNKVNSFIRDAEIISSYIRKYYKKNKVYPTTKMKFYKYGRQLGKGAFGKVNVSLHVLTGRLVAVKSINKTKIVSEHQKQKIALETSIMKTLSKSNYIVKFFESFETKKHINIVMEYICAGDLLTYIRKRSKLSESVAKYIFKQIILGLSFIHSNRIVHRDIKLDNILIDLDNTIKICDFGVSKKINGREIMMEQCGTPAYMAPEILKSRGYSGYAVDLWSAGVVLYAMLSGTVPFKGNDINELHEKIMSGEFKDIPEISSEANHLLNSLLEIDPQKRISCERALAHPWLINVDVGVKQNLFTNAERILLAKSNVDYRNPEQKDDMIENFTLRNIDTLEENINKNVKTKSYILAPFNSSITDDDPFGLGNDVIDNLNKEIKVKNNIIKFVGKLKELNRGYELNNNGDFDNGLLISPVDSVNKKDSLEGKKNDSLGNANNLPNSNDISSKHITPYEPNEVSGNEPSMSMLEVNTKIIEGVSSLGYDKKYIKKCIESNEFNYGTTSYYLLLKYSS